MNNSFNRRKFIRNTAITGLGLAGSSSLLGSSFTTPPSGILEKGRIGMIGLDTSHCIAFAESLNGEKSIPGLSGFKLVGAYPHGSRDIPSSKDRIPQYTEDIKKFGVKIYGSIDELLKNVDVVLLETNDGKMHLEQTLPVLKAGKRLFIDKPVAHSLKDAIAIFEASKKYKVPVFSSSSLRYTPGLQDIATGKVVGRVLGADTFSPCKLEKSHTDLFWYGIHGVESLFTLMGTGCSKVVRMHTEDTDVVTGTWDDGRIGTFRGIRSGKDGYGGTAFGDKDIAAIPPYSGYDPLLVQIVQFFKTGIPPVTPRETLEICAFMEAADLSRKKEGAVISIDSLLDKKTADSYSI